MSEQVKSLNDTISFYTEKAKDINMFQEKQFTKSLEVSILTNIAGSLAIIADKMTEETNK